MEEELLYARVLFKSDGFPSQEQNYVEQTIYDEVQSKNEPREETSVIPDTNDVEQMIYDEVQSKNEPREESPIIPDGKTSPLRRPLQLVAVGLAILCVALMFVIITLSIHLNSLTSEHFTHSNNLTTQNLQLQNEKSDLERRALHLARRAEELTRERDGLNWTLDVILQQDNFAVNLYCSNKVCRPCLDGWLLFQSSCYRFMEDNYSYYWKTWMESLNHCKGMNANLVVIGSREEQEFISNHTKYYSDANHGYWTGLLVKDRQWLWADGSDLTVNYWMTEQPTPNGLCALTIGEKDPLANWRKAGCSMKNRWICEAKALIKSD